MVEDKEEFKRFHEKIIVVCKFKEFARGRCFKSANKRRKDFCLPQMEDISLFKVKTSACQREEQLRKRKNGGTQ